MSILEMENVVGGYGQAQVLHGIDLSVEEGHVAVVLGANGAGKTTTLRAISGLIHCTGDIRFEGTSIIGKPPEVVSGMGIAHVPQGRGTFNELSVDENMRIGAINRKGPEVREDLERWYEAFPRLGERRSQQAGSMSGGEQQMLALGRALMASPRILIIDEPSVGLAPILVTRVVDKIAELKAALGLTVLMAEQNFQQAIRIADRGYVLVHGKIEFSASGVEDLRRSDVVRRLYLGI